MAINPNLPEVCYAYVDEIQQVVGILRERAATASQATCRLTLLAMPMLHALG